MFYLLLRDQADRDAFIEHLRVADIIAPFHYVPLHSAPGGQKYGRFVGNGLPVTDDISARLVRLPMFYDLGNEIGKVIKAARSYFENDEVV